MDELVLVQTAKILSGHRSDEKGFEFLSDDRADKLFKDIEKGFFLSRDKCEKDTNFLQPIPYILIFGPNKTIFSYVRSTDNGDSRLVNRHSIGVGGHINEEDGPNYIMNCLLREIGEEIKIIGNYSEPKIIGTLMSYDKPVDKVHLGIVYKVHIDGDVKSKESALISKGLIRLDDLTNDNPNYETWSEILIPKLYQIYDY